MEARLKVQSAAAAFHNTGLFTGPD